LNHGKFRRTVTVMEFTPDQKYVLRFVLVHAKFIMNSVEPKSPKFLQDLDEAVQQLFVGFHAKIDIDLRLPITELNLQHAMVSTMTSDLFDETALRAIQALWALAVTYKINFTRGFDLIKRDLNGQIDTLTKKSNATPKTPDVMGSSLADWKHNLVSQITADIMEALS
jgi:hypothetical protein